MAKFIELEVIGNSNDFENGKHLINAEHVSTVNQTADQTVVVTLDGGSVASDFITITLSTSTTSAVNPTLTSNKGAKAINDALTANPGGIKSKVFFPKDDAGTPAQIYVHNIAVA
tara:strand:- start:39 stop:383 length:345 start_codon:yes stop_codon:yes gene_type:complete